MSLAKGAALIILMSISESNSISISVGSGWSVCGSLGEGSNLSKGALFSAGDDSSLLLGKRGPSCGGCVGLSLSKISSIVVL